LRVVVLGCGKIGSVMGRDFAGSVEGAELVFADRSRGRAEAAASVVEGASWAKVDTVDFRNLVGALEGFDLALGALPGDYGFRALEAMIEAGVGGVDVSFTPEDPLGLDEDAREAGVTIVPDCGVAPGLSNVLVGYGASRLGGLREAHIMVGGIPEEPVPPLGYTITWSAEGLIDEYVRPVRILEGGRVVEVPALSGLEEVDFPGVGRLEAFYTDGLRSLLRSFPGAVGMWEKTLRYPGHVEGVRLLRELGFFGEEPVEVEGLRVPPRLVAARVLERSLRMPDVGDILAMRIDVWGGSGGIRFRLLDRLDRGTGTSAMARTTGYTASVVAGMLARGEIKEKGVVPPERLGMDEDLARGVLSGLGKRGVEVGESTP